MVSRVFAAGGCRLRLRCVNRAEFRVNCRIFPESKQLEPRGIRREVEEKSSTVFHAGCLVTRIGRFSTPGRSRGEKSIGRISRREIRQDDLSRVRERPVI